MLPTKIFYLKIQLFIKKIYKKEFTIKIMRCKYILNLVLVVVFLGFVSASFEFSESGSLIIKEYQPSEDFLGDLNISFSNQSLESNFTDSFGNYIYLDNLLRGNTRYKITFNDSSNTSINSEFQILSFNGTGFELPSKKGSFSYALKLDGKIVFEKAFEIVDSKSELEDALNKEKSLLNASKHEIGKYDRDTQILLKKFINLSEIESTLNKIEGEYKNMTESERKEALNNLSSISIPTSIYQVTYTEPTIFYSGKESINLDVLAGIEGKEFNKNEQEYLDAIFLWNSNNILNKVVFRSIEIKYSNERTEKIKTFVFTIEEVGESNDAYIIIRDTGDFIFGDSTLNVKKYGNHVYFKTREIPGKFSVLTKENFNFISFPLFISPSIDELKPLSVGEYERWKSKNKWMWFILILLAVLLIGTIIYILIQRWYKQKYETFLFKTKNNMYNIMVYIHDSKTRGIPKEIIEKNLKKSGWTREQINYAMHKYEGKKIAGLINQPANVGSQEPKNNIPKKAVKK